MKILIAFYSRTGNTKKIAEALAEKIGADLEEVKDTVDRSGLKGYLVSGRDAMKKKITKIEPPKFNPADYELTIIGTPIWGWSMSVPIRTYIGEQKDNFDKVAFFCTMGGSGDKNAFLEMEKIIGKKPLRTLSIIDKEVKSGNFSEKVKEFSEKLTV